MRTLRLSLTGMVIFILTTGLSGVVVAGDAEAPASDGPHPVSGTLTYAGSFEASTLTVEEGRYLERGMGTYDTIEMDDARLSGTLWNIWNIDLIGDRQYGSDAKVGTGTVELVNDDGSWVGTMRGYTTMGPRTHHYHIELIGTGGHEGDSAILYVHGPQGGPWDAEGLVFPGVLPEYPDPVVVPAE